MRHWKSLTNRTTNSNLVSQSLKLIFFPDNVERRVDVCGSSKANICSDAKIHIVPATPKVCWCQTFFFSRLCKRP